MFTINYHTVDTSIKVHPLVRALAATVKDMDNPDKLSISFAITLLGNFFIKSSPISIALFFAAKTRILLLSQLTSLNTARNFNRFDFITAFLTALCHQLRCIHKCFVRD